MATSYPTPLEEGVDYVAVEVGAEVITLDRTEKGFVPVPTGLVSFARAAFDVDAFDINSFAIG